MLVATDGSANLAKGVAASGIYFERAIPPLKQSYTIRVPAFEFTGDFQLNQTPANPTNNRGELLAIIHAIRLITRIGYRLPVTILTDSQYCLYVYGWIRDRKPYSTRPNADLVSQLNRAVERATFPFELKKVKAHVTPAQRAKMSSEELAMVALNEKADRLANYELINI